MKPYRIGVLVSGGPAPGINSVISALVIEASNAGAEVVGVYDGFEGLMAGRVDAVQMLAPADVARVHTQGGSLLRTSRADPTRDAAALQRTIESLNRLRIARLVTIGGDGTASHAAALAAAADGRVRVAHAPKTIDNDLPLPGNTPTLGFETARAAGTVEAANLLEDARTTKRWVIAVVMGRSTGHLALGIGLAAGATITVIPEEFARESIRLEDVLILLESSVLKRRTQGHAHGLAIVGEGIIARFPPAEIEKISNGPVARDEHGMLRLGEIPLGTALREGLQRRFAQRKDRVPVVDVTLGYSLRCAPPLPFDIDYARALGHGAVRFLLSDPPSGDLRIG
ncbi:MAG: 6-phosphofructokinase, partial [Chloroflexi bacterium]|nr:6-phosphofructokinase [Chloroflexota bacterium]